MGTVRIETVTPGTRVRVPGTDLEGTLVSCNQCRAIVRQATTARLVEFIDRHGIVRRFEVTEGLENWSPATEVEVVIES